MKKHQNVALSALILLSAMNFAQAKKTVVYPKVYPFVPMSVEEIYNDVENISEDKNFVKNFHEIVKSKYSKGKSKTQPWSSSYWPLGKGTVADPYEDSTIPYYTDFLLTYKYQWKSSNDAFESRKKKVFKNIDELSEKKLSKLAASEKYDLLLGDKNFDLTTRLMEYMFRYGKNNYFGSLSDITAAKDDTAQQAELYVQWGWYKTVEDALRHDIVLKPRIESQRALSLLDSGEQSNAVTALGIVTPQALEDDKNYVIADKKVKNIASWEGICNGWSTAAGIIPRPRKSVSFTLPTGKKLKFYPADIKGLVSLYWFNSFIQNNVQRNDDGQVTGGGSMNVGLRCNHKKVKEDEYGRYYDSKVDPYSLKVEPRCVGVHPAKWHLGLVNIMGKQKRSFIVERKVKSPVDNHPMSSYDMVYYNPYTGDGYKKLEHNIEQITEEDQFKAYRHPKAKYIVGVINKMTYLNYLMPSRDKTDSEKDDKTVTKMMMYDLELDENYNIVGGQWRAKRVGKIKRVRHAGSRIKKKEKRNHNQPDFFWAITKDWKKTGLFSNDSDATKNGAEWKDTTKAPPASWLKVAKQYHSFHRTESTYFGNGSMCNVKNKVTGEKRRVWCEKSTNAPQPLSNIINKLIELSSGVPFNKF